MEYSFSYDCIYAPHKHEDLKQLRGSVYQPVMLRNAEKVVGFLPAN